MEKIRSNMEALASMGGMASSGSGGYGRNFFNMTQYTEDAKNISRYMQVYGMFEKFDGRTYTVYDIDVNKHLFNWTAYDIII